jgi:hypothetical protein
MKTEEISNDKFKFYTKINKNGYRTHNEQFWQIPIILFPSHEDNNDINKILSTSEIEGISLRITIDIIIIVSLLLIFHLRAKICENKDFSLQISKLFFKSL